MTGCRDVARERRERRAQRAGADSARLATASGSDIPARTDAISRSQTSGHSARRDAHAGASVGRAATRTVRRAPTTAATTARAATCVTSHAIAARQRRPTRTRCRHERRRRHARESRRLEQARRRVRSSRLRGSPRRPATATARRRAAGRPRAPRPTRRSCGIRPVHRPRLDGRRRRRRVGSTISTTRRRPVASRSQWTTRSTDAATAGSTKPASMLRPASSGSAASFAERLARGVRVDRRRAGHAGVEREQQVERLGVAHLADDEPIGPHAQRLLHEPAERDLAGALEARLPALQRDEVGRVDRELERLLDRDDAVIGRARGDQRAEQRRLSRVRRARDEDAAPVAPSPRAAARRRRARATRRRRAGRGRGRRAGTCGC